MRQLVFSLDKSQNFGKPSINFPDAAHNPSNRLLETGMQSLPEDNLWKETNGTKID